MVRLHVILLSIAVTLTEPVVPILYLNIDLFVHSVTEECVMLGFLVVLHGFALKLVSDI